MGALPTDPTALPDEKPLHKVVLKVFRIDRYEVTNAEYRKFLEATLLEHPKTCHPDEPVDKRHTPEPKTWFDPEWNAPEMPAQAVDWFDAYAYCAWAGKRLPTEAEWEKAARGEQVRRFPWGDELFADTPVGNFADEAVKKIEPTWTIIETYNDGFPHVAPVGSFPKGASPYGVEDMIGNVWEWVADWYSPTSYDSPITHDPKGPLSGDYRVLRGGAWDSSIHFVRASARHMNLPGYRGNSFGIRCAQDVPE